MDICTEQQEKATPAGYWYRTEVVYCPLCGSTKTYKERCYGPKPVDPARRNIFTEAWDYCGAL